ncbi:MAG: hypothetical protein ACKV2T_15605 [Kofleriaceae bacterium]
MKTLLLASLLAIHGLFTTGCFFTNFQSPRANKAGEITFGVHGAGVLVDGTDGGGTGAATIRVGTSIGEVGGTFTGFGAEATFKVPITDPDGATHVALLGGVGTYLFVFPEINAGLLVGQDVGPVTPYIGYRQHAFAAGLHVGHVIGGVELRVSDSVAILAEANYTNLFAGVSDEDSLLDAFNVPVVSLGLVFGNTRRPSEPTPPGVNAAPLPPTSGPPGL